MRSRDWRARCPPLHTETGLGTNSSAKLPYLTRGETRDSRLAPRFVGRVCKYLMPLPMICRILAARASSSFRSSSLSDGMPSSEKCKIKSVIMWEHKELCNIRRHINHYLKVWSKCSNFIHSFIIFLPILTILIFYRKFLLTLLALWVTIDML